MVCDRVPLELLAQWKPVRRCPMWLDATCRILPATPTKCFPSLSLQLKIQDVHLRFEDGLTNPSHPFAFGVCIKNVSMQNAVNEPVSMRSDHGPKVKPC